MCPVSRRVSQTCVAFISVSFVICLLDAGSLIIQYQLVCHSLFCFDGWLLAIGVGWGAEGRQAGGYNANGTYLRTCYLASCMGR